MLSSHAALSRRAFLRGSSLVVVGGLLAACASPPATTSPAATSAPAPTSPPVATSAPASTPAATTAARSTTVPATTPAPAATTGPAATTAPAVAGASSLSGEVTFSDPAALQAGTSDVIKRLFAAFQKTYPNVTVRDVSLPFAQYNNQILSQIQSGSPPDLIHVDDTTLPVFIKNATSNRSTPG
jgi:ABC-type glycerol-3-phosphate transport system substrate-binding protein